MELEELKNLYVNNGEKLNQSLKINQELFKRMNLISFKKELQNPRVYEIANIILCISFISIFIALSFELLYDLKYSLSGFISAILLGIYLIMSLIKLGRMNRIEYYNSPVIKLQKELTFLRKTILRMRKVELFILLIVIITMFPVLFKAIYNVNIYADIKLYFIMVIIFFAVNIPLIIWINRSVYDRKMKNAQNFLDDLNKFEE